MPHVIPQITANQAEWWLGNARILLPFYCTTNLKVIDKNTKMPLLYMFYAVTFILMSVISRWDTSWGPWRKLFRLNQRRSQVYSHPYITGAAQVPVTGFDPEPSVKFIHDESKLIPSASTCSNTLYLYVNETTIQNPIHRYFLTAMMNGGIFSKIWVFPTME